MSEYEFVNVRFNLEREDEKFLFSKLNPANKGGSIKEYLKSFFALNEVDLMKKTELKEIIKDILDNEINPRIEEKIEERSNSSQNGIRIVVNGKEKFL